MTVGRSAGESPGLRLKGRRRGGLVLPLQSQQDDRQECHGRYTAVLFSGDARKIAPGEVAAC